MNKINKLISCILTLSFLSANSSFAMDSCSDLEGIAFYPRHNLDDLSTLFDNAGLTTLDKLLSQCQVDCGNNSSLDFNSIKSKINLADITTKLFIAGIDIMDKIDNGEDGDKGQQWDDFRRAPYACQDCYDKNLKKFYKSVLRDILNDSNNFDLISLIRELIESADQTNYHIAGEELTVRDFITGESIDLNDSLSLFFRKYIVMCCGFIGVGLLEIYGLKMTKDNIRNVVSHIAEKFGFCDLMSIFIENETKK